jgi:RNA 2',3'-cyclic 3'-phosphodiesterase
MGVKVTQHDLFGEAQTTSARHVRKPSGQARHTWFFALRPSVDDARRIHALAGELLAFHGVPGKRLDPDRLHITLALVGQDVEASIVDAACGAVDMVSLPGFDVRFDAAMTFSAPAGPLVLLGGEGLDEVRKLRTSLGCALADQGFKPPRAYEPHMTLCYDARHRLAKTPVEPIRFRVDEFALVKSHVGLSRHEVLRTWQLTG